MEEEINEVSAILAVHQQLLAEIKNTLQPLAAGDPSYAKLAATQADLSVEISKLTATLQKLRSKIAVRITFGKEHMQKKFPRGASVSDLRAFVVKTWNRFAMEEFSILSGGAPLEDTEPMRDYAENDRVDLEVQRKSKGFSSFSIEEGLAYIGVGECAEENVDDTEFPPHTFDLDAPLAEFPGRTARLVLEKSAQDLYERIQIFDPDTHSREYTRREFISPLLLAAAILSSGVSLRAELQLAGRLGHGSVDYAVIYKHHCVILSEVKDQHKVLEALGQALAEMAASREQYARMTPVVGDKRKFEETLTEVPSICILTNGSIYYFIRFVGAPVKAVVRSKPFRISIAKETSQEVLRLEVEKLVSLIVGILEGQKAAVTGMISKR